MDYDERTLQQVWEQARAVPGQDPLSTRRTRRRSGFGYAKSSVYTLDLRAGHPCPASTGCFSTAC